MPWHFTIQFKAESRSKRPVQLTFPISQIDSLVRTAAPKEATVERSYRNGRASQRLFQSIKVYSHKTVPNPTSGCAKHVSHSQINFFFLSPLTLLALHCQHFCFSLLQLHPEFCQTCYKPIQQVFGFANVK